MDTAPVKAIALPAVYRANLEFQSHVPLQHSRTRSRIRARADAEESALQCIHYTIVIGNNIFNSSGSDGLTFTYRWYQ